MTLDWMKQDITRIVGKYLGADIALDPLFKDIEAAMLSVAARVERETIERVEAISGQWAKHGELLLRCGEMKAAELRTAKAVANGINGVISALPRKYQEPSQ